MLVKFLNSDSKVSTAIAGSYFKGDGWTGAYYDAETGQLVFESEDGLGFVTEDLRVATGGASSVEWAEVQDKPVSFPPSTHTHLWAEVQDKPVSFPPDLHAHTWESITDKPTEFTPVSHNHVISDVIGLQAALTEATDTLATLQDEIREARENQLAISAFAGSNAGGIVPGRYYDNATSGANSGIYNSTGNRADMCVFLTSLPLTVDQIGLSVSTSGSNAYGRAFIYGCGATGWPSNLLYESNTDLDLNSSSFRGETLASPFTFEANRIYWVGWRFGTASTYAVMRGLAVTSMPNLGLGSSTGNTYCSVIRRSIPFTTPMPTTWDFAESDLTANTIGPSIRMRAV